jgi:hypothetical protein
MDWDGYLTELPVLATRYEKYVETLTQYFPFVK